VQASFDDRVEGRPEPEAPGGPGRATRRRAVGPRGRAQRPPSSDASMTAAARSAATAPARDTSPSPPVWVCDARQLASCSAGGMSPSEEFSRWWLNQPTPAATRSGGTDRLPKCAYLQVTLHNNSYRAWIWEPGADDHSTPSATTNPSRIGISGGEAISSSTSRQTRRRARQRARRRPRRPRRGDHASRPFHDGSSQPTDGMSPCDPRPMSTPTMSCSSGQQRNRTAAGSPAPGS